MKVRISFGQTMFVSLVVSLLFCNAYAEEPIGKEPIGEEPIGKEPISKEPISKEPIEPKICADDYASVGRTVCDDHAECLEGDGAIACKCKEGALGDGWAISSGCVSEYGKYKKNLFLSKSILRVRITILHAVVLVSPAIELNNICTRDYGGNFKRVETLNAFDPLKPLTKTDSCGGPPSSHMGVIVERIFVIKWKVLLKVIQGGFGECGAEIRKSALPKKQQHEIVNCHVV
ncbi:hypothetical protein pdam_00023188 [Pocillopora damicornis]|uniref:EGF-like domain-containing protein n=1 Tax=Pocillopora damicornis TaxID=46731 RepID=A0A3M6TN14_POCDA|nr:hypothetical protein pdam_00023188 [Pocillopora damicornis]